MSISNTVFQILVEYMRPSVLSRSLSDPCPSHKVCSLYSEGPTSMRENSAAEYGNLYFAKQLMQFKKSEPAKMGPYAPAIILFAFFSPSLAKIVIRGRPHFRFSRRYVLLTRVTCITTHATQQIANPVVRTKSLNLI